MSDPEFFASLILYAIIHKTLYLFICALIVVLLSAVWIFTLTRLWHRSMLEHESGCLSLMIILLSAILFPLISFGELSASLSKVRISHILLLEETTIEGLPETSMLPQHALKEELDAVSQHVRYVESEWNYYKHEGKRYKNAYPAASYYLYRLCSTNKLCRDPLWGSLTIDKNHFLIMLTRLLKQSPNDLKLVDEFNLYAETYAQESGMRVYERTKTDLIPLLSRLHLAYGFKVNESRLNEYSHFWRSVCFILILFSLVCSYISYNLINTFI